MANQSANNRNYCNFFFKLQLQCLQIMLIAFVSITNTNDIFVVAAAAAAAKKKSIEISSFLSF